MRFSPICARLSWDRALFLAAWAAMNSFCGETCSTLSISSSGSPRLTWFADVGDQTDDPAGEGRHNDGGGVFIERDLTDRPSLNAEGIGLDLHHFKLVHLIGDNTHIVAALRGPFGRRK